MSEMKIEVSKEEYEQLNQMEYGPRTKIVTSKLPQHILMGYGYYGHTLRAVDGKYYIVCSIGSSCD